MTQVVVMWDEFHFVDAIVDGGIWRSQWHAHGSSIELLKGGVTKCEGVLGHHEVQS